MPQVDVQWSSDDEEFDTTANAGQLISPQFALAGAGVEMDVSEADASSDNQVNYDEVSGGGDEPAGEPSSAPESSSAPEPESAPEPSSTSEEPPVAANNAPAAPDKPKRKAPSKHLLLEVVLLVALVAVGLWAWNLSSDNSNLKDQVKTLNNNPAIVQQRDTQNLLSQVGKLYKLPSNETPTIAVVSDAAAAKKSSTFFTSAVNGDKVLLYTKNGLAILYRPSENKLVQVGPLFTNSSAATTTGTSTTKH